MAKWRLTGFEDYIRALNRLGNQLVVEDYIGKAIYEGAKVVADATKSALKTLPTTSSDKYALNGKQKKGLIESYGIAPSRWDGTFLNVKVGFDGYNEITTKRWPQGQPNVVVARALESGTSFIRKNPIISRTENANRGKCIEAMQKSLDKSIDEIMK